MIEPIWLSVARAFVGLKEVAGPQSSPVILRWARDIDAPAWYDDDSRPWCAVFANRLMLACQLPMAGKGFDLLRAKSFETWGQPLVKPTLGAVLTFSRPEGAHIGLYLGEKDDAYHVLGGNQNNSVSTTWILKNRLTSIRWPSGVPVQSSGPVMLLADGSAISEDEA